MNTMIKQLLFPGLFFLLFSCTSPANKPAADKPRDTFGLLSKKWVSVSEIIAGKEKNFADTFSINLKPDSTFESFYMPDNHKKGFWRLNNDSTFTLYMKASDSFKITGLTDSTLSLEIQWMEEKPIVKFRIE
jgi:hypothetical protein